MLHTDANEVAKRINFIEVETQLFWTYRRELRAAIDAGNTETALDVLSEIELIAEYAASESLRAAAQREIAAAQKLDLGPLCYPGEEGVAGFRMPASWQVA